MPIWDLRFAIGSQRLLFCITVLATMLALAVCSWSQEATPEVRTKSGEPMSKARALREAKCWLRTYTDSKGVKPFQHPSYWSAFILIGQP